MANTACPTGDLGAVKYPFHNQIKARLRHSVEEPLEELAGGPARLKVILLLACVLGLDAADKATIGAVAMQLKHAMHIGDVQVGLLVTASTAVGALVTLPFGMLADRFRRTRLLVMAMMVWSLALAANGTATSYSTLLLTRLALGAVVAAASPVVVSLIGDFFAPGERGRIFGYVLAGELLGVAIGFLVSGNLAAALSWRAAFWLLALVGMVLSGIIWRCLPEPARGGRSYVPEGADTVPASSEDSRSASCGTPARERSAQDDLLAQLVHARGITPREDQVRANESERLTLWQAVRHTWSIRTFRTLVIASTLGYFYFTGLRTFALMYMRQTFDLSQAAASTLSVAIGSGAIAGALLVGRMGDRLMRHGRLTGRVQVGALAYFIAAAALLGGLWTQTLFVAAPLLFVAAMGIGGANPAVDAARLDVIHSSLWGRAEGIRATFRFTLEAGAAPLFGYVASCFAGTHLSTTADTASGMGPAMTLMLVTLVAAGTVLIWRTTRTYPRDVATNLVSERVRGAW